MSKSDYKSIPEIIEELKANSERMESGQMPLSDLEDMLSQARELYERATILRYKAIEELAGKKSKGDEGFKDSGFRLNFTINTPEVDENQTSLIDAIEEEVKKESTSSVKENHVPEEEVVPLMEEPDIEEKPSKKDKIAEQLEIKPSLNDTMGTSENTLVGKLTMSPIDDLIKAIGINQKFLFMNDLFQGENDLYAHAIENLNSLRSFEEAESVLKELKKKYDWEEEDKTVETFTILIQRRYL